MQFVGLFLIHPVGRGIPDAPLIVLFTYGKSENCSNFRRTVQEAGPYGIVRYHSDKLQFDTTETRNNYDLSRRKLRCGGGWRRTRGH